MKEMPSNPLVSICIPTYNRASMVGEAIRSALDQTYSPVEVLVVDNASTDTIEDVVSSFRDPRLKLVKNEKNLGLFGNFNRCVELARGKYIHILHSDDYIDPGFTGTCVGFMESHPGVAMTFTSVTALSGEDQNRICTCTQDTIYPAPEGFREILRSRSMISCPSVMIRSDVYDTVGLYSLEYPYSGDLYQWLRIARRFDIAYVAGATLYYRQGEHSESFRLLFRSPLGYIDTIKIFIRVMDELGSEAALYRRDLNTALRRHLRDCLFAGTVRSDLMAAYSPLIFIGFAFNTWSLILPESIVDRLKKFSEFFLITAIACVFCIPGGRYGMRKLLGIRQDRY
jgi:glycosyltransferase involved in cell wall biosynthesis